MGISNSRNGFGKCDEDRMFRCSCVAGIQFALPLVEKFERCVGVADFVPEIVRNAAVGVDIEKMLTQSLRQEPGCDRKILVMRLGEVRAVFAGPLEVAGLGESRRPRGGGSIRGPLAKGPRF